MSSSFCFIWPFGVQDPVEWKENMEKEGTFADEVFVMLTAISINRDIVIVPVHEESATIPDPGISIYKVKDVQVQVGGGD